MSKTRDMSNLLNSTPSDVDATKLDSLDSSQFVRSDADDSISGDLTLSGDVTSTGDITTTGTVSGTIDYGDLINLPDPTVTLTGFASGSGTLTDLGNVSITTTRTTAPTFTFTGDVTGSKTITTDSPSITLSYDTTAFTNKLLSVDGSGSNLDADKLDGEHGSHYLDYDNFTNTTALMAEITANDGPGSDLNADKLDGEHGSHYLDYDNFTNVPTSITDFSITDGVAGQYLGTDGNGNFAFSAVDPGDSLNAAFLDNIDSSQFVRSDTDDSLVGNYDITGTLDVVGNVDFTGTLDVSSTITGDLTGDVTGDVTGNVTGNVTGDVTGDVTSDVVTVNETVELAAQSAHPSFSEGRLWYDNIHKTLNYYSDVSDVIHEIGIEEHQRVYNNTGSTISKGKPLYFSGNYTSGDIDVPTVGLANATDVNKYNAQGLAAGDIANNSYGYCIIAGQIDGLDTSALTAGSNFFVGLTDGAVQNASPTYPNFPMCLGWVVNSDASDGVLLVNQQNHSVNSFRVRTSAHIGTDLRVDGNLTVAGTQTTVSTNDVTAGAAMYRLNEGNAIGESGTTFSGTGLDDAFFSGHFTGTTSTTYYVRIDSVGGGTNGVDTFEVSTDNFVTTLSTDNDITGSAQSIHSADNISVEFGATTGHTLNDTWTGTAAPVDVDTGLWSNRNTGSSGVGYTHMGLFYDTSEDKWTFVDEYDPTPDGTINTSHASYQKATVVAETFEGDLTGDVTGDVTGDLTGNVTGDVTGDLTGDVTAGTITTTGNIGIKQSNPTTLLYIGDGSESNVPITLSSSTGGTAEFRHTSSSGEFKFTNGNGSNEHVRIDSSGRLLVGTTSNNGAGGGTIVAGDAAATAGGVALQVRYAADDSLVNYGSQYSSGDALIGYGVASSQTTANTFISTADNSNFSRGALTVGDQLRFFQASSQTTTKGSNVTMTERFRVEADGDAHFDGDVTAFSTTVSDVRLKDDIQVIDNPLEKLNQLNGYTFNYTKDNRESAGILAQEVENVLPSAVSTKKLAFNDDKEYKTVEYNQLIGLLIEAVKELDKKID